MDYTCLFGCPIHRSLFNTIDERETALTWSSDRRIASAFSDYPAWDYAVVPKRSCDAYGICITSSRLERVHRQLNGSLDVDELVVRKNDSTVGCGQMIPLVDKEE